MAGPNLWVSVQQWQEDRPPAGSGDRVDGAQFVNGGPSGRMYIEGENISPLSQSTPFTINNWHEYVVHGVWTDQNTGYLEWWIDNTYVGRTDRSDLRDRRSPLLEGRHHAGHWHRRHPERRHLHR